MGRPPRRAAERGRGGAAAAAAHGLERRQPLLGLGLVERRLHRAARHRHRAHHLALARRGALQRTVGHVAEERRARERKTQYRRRFRPKPLASLSFAPLVHDLELAVLANGAEVDAQVAAASLRRRWRLIPGGRVDAEEVRAARS